jgi:pimeloyl-ACP methyl ester carboxylesterase
MDIHVVSVHAGAAKVECAPQHAGTRRPRLFPRHPIRDGLGHGLTVFPHTLAGRSLHCRENNVNQGSGRLWHIARDYATHALVGGSILLLTGFVPEEFLAHVVREAHIPADFLHLWSTGIDIRVAAVVVGMSIIVGDLVLRRRMTSRGIASPANLPAEASPAIPAGSDAVAAPAASPMPPVRYCTTRDGIHLAYAIDGEGPPLVYVGHWFGHLQMDWEYPARRRYFELLGRGRTLLRYDTRGNGLSDHNVDNISHETWVSDLETVVDAAGFQRFALFGLSQTASVAIAYAARHPERVTRLVVYGGYALGWKRRPGVNLEEQRAMLALTRVGWDRDNPAFRQMFTAQFMPGATKEAFDAFTEMGRKYTTGEAVTRFQEATGDADVVSLLPLVAAPTLVMHVRDDQRVPFECGQQIAAGIPGARLVALPGQNHILQEGERAREQMFEEIDSFLQR